MCVRRRLAGPGYQNLAREGSPKTANTRTWPARNSALHAAKLPAATRHFLSGHFSSGACVGGGLGRLNRTADLVMETRIAAFARVERESHVQRAFPRGRIKMACCPIGKSTMRLGPGIFNDVGVQVTANPLAENGLCVRSTAESSSSDWSPV